MALPMEFYALVMELPENRHTADIDLLMSQRHRLRIVNSG